jgi:hypothetical protein
MPDTSEIEKEIKKIETKIKEIEAETKKLEALVGRFNNILQSLLAFVGADKPSDVRATCDWRRGVRRFRSGIVGLAYGQTARVHIVNATLELDAVTKSAWVQGWANQRSEPLGEGAAFSLPSGASVFQDFHPDPTVGIPPRRAQIRVMITVLDDPRSECIVTFEIFDDESGRAAMIMQIPEDT